MQHELTCTSSRRAACCRNTVVCRRVPILLRKVTALILTASDMRLRTTCCPGMVHRPACRAFCSGVVHCFCHVQAGAAVASTATT